MKGMTNTIKPPERVWLWVCPKGHVERAARNDTREFNVCWACYPGGRIHNQGLGPQEMQRFVYSVENADA